MLSFFRIANSACDHYLDVCCKVDSKPRDRKIITRPVASTFRPIGGSSTTPRTKSIKKIKACGIRQPSGIDFKITGNINNEAEYGEFPWMVALIEKNNSQANSSFAFCGASLIDQRFVLTAAHCVSR